MGEDLNNDRDALIINIDDKVAEQTEYFKAQLDLGLDPRDIPERLDTAVAEGVITDDEADEIWTELNPVEN